MTNPYAPQRYQPGDPYEAGVSRDEQDRVMTPRPAQPPAVSMGVGGGGFDWFSQGGLLVPRPPRLPNIWTDPVEVKHWNARQKRWVGTGAYESWIIINDYAGGTNGVMGDFDLMSGKVAYATMDTSVPNYATLPIDIAVSESTSPVFASVTGLHWANFAGVCALGIGSTNNYSLFSATTGTPSARTYNPGGAITSLTVAPIGGATVAERLIIGRLGAAADIVTDLAATPTDLGTNMHADTQALWGAIKIPGGISSVTAGAPALLGYSQSGLWWLNCADAVNTQPTVRYASVPQGGRALGISTCMGEHRAFWLFPKANNTSGAMAGTGRFDIYSTDLEGNDLMPVATKGGPVWDASLLGDDQIVYTNQHGVWRIIKRQHEPLAPFRERDLRHLNAALGDHTLTVRNLAVADEDLYIQAIAEDASSAPAGAWFEKYDFETREWHPSSESRSLSEISDSIEPYRNGPLAFATPANASPLLQGYFHWAMEGSSRSGWYRQPIHQPGQNPFWSLQAGQAKPTARNNSAVLVSAAMTNRKMLGWRHLCAGMSPAGYFDSVGGSDDTQLDLEVAIQGPTDHLPTFTNSVKRIFKESDPVNERALPLRDNRTASPFFQYKATFTRATGASNSTPNLLPLMFRVLSFPPGREVQSPQEVGLYD